MFKKLLQAGNLLYFVLIAAASVYLIFKEGLDSYCKFGLILLALFLPILISIRFFRILKQFISKEDIKKKEILILTVLVIATVAVYAVGLEKSQRVLVLLFDAILCFFIILIMSYLVYRGKKG